MIGLIIDIILGGIIGYVASRFMGSKSSILIDIIVGIVGSAIGGIIVKALNLNIISATFTSILFGIVGACLLIFILRKLNLFK